MLKSIKSGQLFLAIFIFNITIFIIHLSFWTATPDTFTYTPRKRNIPLPKPIISNTSRVFDPRNHTLVFFHIQKTSGTNFDLDLLEHMQVYDMSTRAWRRSCIYLHNSAKNTRKTEITSEISYQCAKSPPVDNETWIVSGVRASGFGWQCGLHPDLSDLRSCLKQKFANSKHDGNESSFYYISMLRNPVARFISEYYHTQASGSMWIFESEPVSEGQRCAKAAYVKCLRSEMDMGWRGVSLDEFMECEWSLAVNRQTRMLADYDEEFSVCSYLNSSSMTRETTGMDEVLLRRAKRALHSLSFFGIAEYQYYSKSKIKFYESDFLL
jgi:hypothetical protein